MKSDILRFESSLLHKMTMNKNESLFYLLSLSLGTFELLLLNMGRGERGGGAASKGRQF